MGLAIVAIPEENDRVWKVSSEKVPHLTLLFLGEAENADLQQIMQFVEHAVTMSEHGPFYLDVDRRDTLGEDEADVLFFNKRSWNLKWIKQFRGQLLQNGAVRSAYDSTEQFPEWRPHLTLGYPETPAKPIPDDGFNHPLYSVAFDRIAVWEDNYEGPEFRLEWPDRELEGDLAVAYSDTQKAALIHYGESPKQENEMPQTAELGEEFLEHYGKKGMRWGVRNERQRQTGPGAARRGAHAQKAQRLHKKADALERAANATKRDTLRRRSLNANATKARKQADAAQRIADGNGPGKAAAKKVASGAKKVGKGAVHVAKDVYFESSFGKDTATRTVAHAAAKNWAEKDVPRLNAEYKGTKGGTVKGRLKNPLAKETIEYRSRSRAAYRDRINEEVAKLPTNASGSRRYEIHDNGKTNANYLWTLKAVDVKRSSGLDHAAKDEPVGLEDFQVRPTFDEDGFIIGFVQESPSTSAEHGEAFVEGLVHGAADLGEAFIIEHYGIKGMRWGRRSSPTAVTPTATSKVPHGAKRKTQIETKGGENHPASQDAIKVETARVKLKKSGPKALSNQELREVAERIRLERQAVVLDRSKGSAFVRSILGNQGKQAANEVVRETIRENITSKTKK